MEALAGNVRQARLMKNTPPLRGAFRLPFATAHGPSVPAPSGQPPLQGGLSFPLDANWYHGRRQAVGVVNTVRELLGHADLKMTLQYAHLAPEAKARAVEALDL